MGALSKHAFLDDASLQKRGDFILSFAAAIFSNGQSTGRVIAQVTELSASLHARVHLMLHWDAVLIEISDHRTTLVLSTAARPTAVSMNRVVSAMAVVLDVRENRLNIGRGATAMIAVAQIPSSPVWMFALAGAGGAAAVALLSGLQDMLALTLTFVSGGTGALLRRFLAKRTSNLFLQPFAAALLAGAIAAIVQRCSPGAALFLVAVSPCLILVPGPHFLNGALDLISGRIQLGAARLTYATLVVLAASFGLLLGLAAFGISLPVEGSVGAISIWEDAVAAGIAIAAYGTFFAMPPRMLVWPLAIGMLAHAVKWAALAAFGLHSVAAVFCACVVVGTLVTPVSHRTHAPFAALGFASVVSMMPGALMFETVSGFLQIDGAHPSAALIGHAVSTGTTAAATILAMSVGLIVPKLMMDRLWDAKAPQRRRANNEFLTQSEAIK